MLIGNFKVVKNKSVFASKHKSSSCSTRDF